MSKDRIREIPRKGGSGYVAMVLLPGLLLIDAWLFYKAVGAADTVLLVVTAIAAIVLVVLCGEENAQPVLNAGTLYN